MRQILKWGCLGVLAIMVCVVGLTLVFAIADFSPDDTKTVESPSTTSQASISQPRKMPEPVTVSPTEGPTSAPEITVRPTKTLPESSARSTTTAEPAPVPVTDLIVSVAELLGTPLEEIESQFGPGSMATQMPAGAIEAIPEGGEMRLYSTGKYSFSVAYDQNGIARGFQIMDGLAEDGFSLDQWALLLNRFGLLVTDSPDVEMPAAMRWNDFQGYRIEIIAMGLDGPVWTVKIWKPVDRVAATPRREPTEPAAKPYVQVKEGSVNIRQGPDTSFPVVGQMRAGDRYTIVGKTPDQQWWQVCCVSERPAWVAAWVVEAVGDTASVPVAEDIPEPPATYETIDIRELDAYTDDHVGEKIRLEGTVFNIGEDFFQINVRKPGGSTWDTIPVIITYLTIEKPRGVYEDTRIRVYGEVMGRLEGTNAFGGAISQVWVDAEMIERLDGQATASKPTPISPQSLPQIGQTITAGGWEFKVYDVKKRKAVYFYGDAYIAYGHFLLVFVEAVNRNPGTASFSDLDPYVADLSGQQYDDSIKASIYAQWQYEGLGSYYDDVNPGNLIRIVHAYDLADTVGDVFFGVKTGEKIYLGNFAARPSEDN